MKKLHLFSAAFLFMFYPYTVGATIFSTTLSDPITILGADYFVTFSQSDTIGENSFSNIDPGLTLVDLGDYNGAFAAGNEIAAAIPDSFIIFSDLPNVGGDGHIFIMPFDLGGSVVHILGVDLRYGSCCTVLANINDDPVSWINSPWASFQAVAGPSTVPVPAAAWLFGSALLGFFGFSRRKANA